MTIVNLGNPIYATSFTLHATNELTLRVAILNYILVAKILFHSSGNYHRSFHLFIANKNRLSKVCIF